MLATMIAERASLSLVTVPLPWRVQGVMLRCPSGRGIGVLVSSRLDAVGRCLVVEQAIRAAERGSAADLMTQADLGM